ncbi:hypothetical protein Daus18300_000521 [Diaporthe australafricana]|uniref:Protein-arginine deiminase C-terminal domain-containing protein n=1 Tax=Diaporthe australafricana TaxID=127596 RepID=A0ABR3Y4Y3_9PEZI
MYKVSFTVSALLSPICLGFKADIRADTNRDGLVDVTGDTDVNGKDAWNNSSGAIFLANIGDTYRRCSKLATACLSPELSLEALAACNDASDDILRQAEYLAPLRTLPMPDLSPNALGTVSANPASSKNVRIFSRNGTDWWTFVDANTTFTSAQLKTGLKLGIDARDTRRPGGWDGRTTISFTVTDGTVNSTDMVMLRVAPILTHNHLQSVDRVLTTAGNGNVTKPDLQQKFALDLSRIVASKGIEDPVYEFEQGDVWAQDFFEAGYTSMPGPNGTIAMRIIVRSSEDNRDSGRQVFEDLREAGVGAVQHLGGVFDGISSMGNLETIPPYEHNGTKYPAGRIITGSHGEKDHHTLDYMEAQEVQDPLTLDTDWLAVGHVDEFVQFVAANTTRGWAIVVADPEAGLELLRGVQRIGKGSTNAFSRPEANDIEENSLESTPPAPGADFKDSNITGRDLAHTTSALRQLTVDGVLADTAMRDLNAACARRISANIVILKEATGVTDEEIYRLPSVFSYHENSPKADAFYPGMINGLVLSRTDYVSPKPWGPLVDGKDIFEEAANSIYAKVGLEVTYLDVWVTHHIMMGEVHCGTNTFRQIDEAWW